MKHEAFLGRFKKLDKLLSKHDNDKTLAGADFDSAKRLLAQMNVIDIPRIRKCICPDYDKDHFDFVDGTDYSDDNDDDPYELPPNYDDTDLSDDTDEDD